MERHRFSHSLPLYRVQYQGSQTAFNHESGLTARDTTSFFNEDNEFCDSIIQAFTWGSVVASPYIALFSEKNYAENWLLSWGSQEYQERQLITINTCQLNEIYFFKLSTLLDNLGIVLPGGASQHRNGAYLCLHHIPAEAICNIESGRAIESRREHQLWTREEYVDHSVEMPGTHWCSELNGYYDTDSEVEQNNTNDDLIKTIEGDWN